MYNIGLVVFRHFKWRIVTYYIFKFKHEQVTYVFWIYIILIYSILPLKPPRVPLIRFLQKAVQATGAVDPQRKLMGTWVIEWTLQTGCEDMMGSGETCAGTESLIRLIDDRLASPWKSTIDGTWPPLNITSADIPPVSANQDWLQHFHMQTNGCR